MKLELKEPNINLRSFTQYVVDSRYKMVHNETTWLALEFLALSNALGGEVGELQNIVKKIIKNNDFYCDSDLHGKFVLEAGDALHYLISLINIAGYTPEFIMACNVQKLDARKQEQAHEEETTVLPTTPTQPRT